LILSFQRQGYFYYCCCCCCLWSVRL